MTVGNFSDNMDNLVAMIGLLDQNDRWMRYNSPNFVTKRNTLDAALGGVGNRLESKKAQLQSLEVALSNPLSPGEVRTLLGPFLADVVESTDIAVPSRGFAEDYRVLRDYMRDNSQTVKSRNLTYGSVSAGGSNQGTASVYILTEDSNGDPLEGVAVEPFSIEVLEGRLEGRRKYSELYAYKGTAAALTQAEVRGSGILEQVLGAFGDSENLLQNGRFQQFTGTRPSAGSPVTAPSVTAFPGWTLDSVTDCQADADQYYKSQPNETTPISVRFNTAARSLTQTLIKARKPRLYRERPYLFSAAYLPQNSADGTARLDIGAYNATVSVSGSTWQRLAMALNQNTFYRVWGSNDEDRTVKLSWVSPTAGQLYWADALLVPFVRVNGFWIAVVSEETSGVAGSAPTVGDVWTATFSEPGSQPSSRGVNQYWLTYRSGVNEETDENDGAMTLPSAASGYETISDPS